MISLEKEIEKREETLREREQFEKRIEELEAGIVVLKTQRDELEKLLTQKDYSKVEEELRFLRTLVPVSEPVVPVVSETMVSEVPAEPEEKAIIEAPVEIPATPEVKVEEAVEEAPAKETLVEPVETPVKEVKIESPTVVQNTCVVVTPSTQQTAPRTTDPFGATVGRINF